MKFVPEIIDGTPNVYIQLMTQCWDSDLSKRPTASQLYELIESWVIAIRNVTDISELSVQFDIAEEKNFSDLEGNKFHQQEIHSRAIYTSRSCIFPNLLKVIINKKNLT